MFTPSQENDSDTFVIHNSLYAASEIGSMLRWQDQIGLKHLAIFTDIHESWDSFITRPQRKQLDTICRKYFIPRVALTGYSIDNELREHAKDQTSLFDILVSSGGTRIDIRYKDENKTELYVQDTEYEKTFISNSFWNKDTVLEQSKSIIQAYRNKYPNCQFKFQKENGGTELYRIGFHFFASSLEERNEIYTAIQALFPHLRIVAAEDRDFNMQFRLDEWPRKFCLDIAAAHKLDAAQYIVNVLGIDNGLGIGNATNDLEFMLYTPHIMPVLVGGSTIDAHSIIDKMIVYDTSSPFVTLSLGSDVRKKAYIEQDTHQIATQTTISVLKTIVHDILQQHPSIRVRSYLQNLYKDLKSIT